MTTPRKRPSRKPAPVTVTKPNALTWAYARELAAGRPDVALESLPDGSVRIVNRQHPRG
jgi:hypothetical protein